MLGNYLIGLREGLEAALVVSILVAYLVRTGRQSQVRFVWAGVGLAVVLSVAVGALLEFTSANLSFTAQERFGGIMSIVAVAFVTWMIFWMRTAARSIAKELQGKLDSAVAIGGTAVVVLAFIAVAREGLETSVFFWTAAKATESTWTPVIGFALGLGTAIALGVALYKSAVKINLAVFFKWTGLLLIFVAAGVLSYGVHDLQEAGDLPGLNNLLFDVSAQVPPGSWYGTLLKGVFNFSPTTTVLEGVVWITYVVVCLFFYLRPSRTVSKPAPQASVPA
ncbi:MAG TPA: iron uptake transporter permease EfeU [Candidatus Limnocylindria bacterium]|nr:iron uptake transporter permease EfeU [Candidatus Limnocylindria bacterium]